MFKLSSDTTMKTLTRLGLAALLTLPLAAAAQHVYRCPGADGRMIYTDKPCRTGAKLKMSHKGIGSSVKVEAATPKRSERKVAPVAAPAAASAASAASAAPAPAEPQAAPQAAPQATPQAQGVQL